VNKAGLGKRRSWLEYLQEMVEEKGCAAGKPLLCCFLPDWSWLGAQEYKEFYVDDLQEAQGQGLLDYAVRGEPEFKTEPPSSKWTLLDDSREIHPYNPAIVRLLLKRGLNRYIIVRSGKQEEYGVSEMMELLDAELAYLAKMGESGDFLGKQKITVSNELFRNRDFFLYDIRRSPISETRPILSADKTTFIKRTPSKPTKKDLCVMIKDRGNIRFFELYTTVKHYPEDVEDFIKFLESVKGPSKKDTIDRIKEKAKQH
jgi:hypothetical protein